MTTTYIKKQEAEVAVAKVVTIEYKDLQVDQTNDTLLAAIEPESERRHRHLDVSDETDANVTRLIQNGGQRHEQRFAVPAVRNRYRLIDQIVKIDAGWCEHPCLRGQTIYLL